MPLIKPIIFTVSQKYCNDRLRTHWLLKWHIIPIFHPSYLSLPFCFPPSAQASARLLHLSLRISLLRLGKSVFTNYLQTVQNLKLFNMHVCKHISLSRTLNCLLPQWTLQLFVCDYFAKTPGIFAADLLADWNVLPPEGVVIYLHSPGTAPRLIDFAEWQSQLGQAQKIRFQDRSTNGTSAVLCRNTFACICTRLDLSSNWWYFWPISEEYFKSVKWLHSFYWLGLVASDWYCLQIRRIVVV